ncbi:hypothetical protein TrispH2_011755 [Trichoplax sp. H2]|nr:hypothetical protein TrispH2_011755 [Trichoplax sp. H2]|eukprot:RDD35941.1 hypothetical protein TrispH2_011755 [Trichoplax sp. H2]
MKLDTANTSAFESSDTSTTSPHKLQIYAEADERLDGPPASSRSILDLQQCQDVFQHYFSSIHNENKDSQDDSQFAKI